LSWWCGLARLTLFTSHHPSVNAGHSLTQMATSKLVSRASPWPCMLSMLPLLLCSATHPSQTNAAIQTTRQPAQEKVLLPSPRSFSQPTGFSFGFFLPSTPEKWRHRSLWKGSQPNWKKAGTRCDNQHEDTLPKCISLKIYIAVMYFSISFSKLCKGNTKEKTSQPVTLLPGKHAF